VGDFILAKPGDLGHKLGQIRNPAMRSVLDHPIFRDETGRYYT